jgi:chemotaxis protein CheD
VNRREIMVRMGELATSTSADDMLVSLALGSCIGVCMVDRRRGIAGLAHVMLPESPAATSDLGRFADTAVPELLRRVLAHGALRPRLEVSIVGGAQMFSFTSDGGVGQRNETAVRAALKAERLKVLASETGGSTGRTVRLEVATGDVYVKAAGAKPQLLAPAALKAAA